MQILNQAAHAVMDNACLHCSRLHTVLFYIFLSLTYVGTVEEV